MVAAVAAMVVCLTPTLLAHTPDGKQPRASMYNAATEATLTGSIEAVQEIACTDCGGRRSLGGTHVTLKTATETIEVHLGPSAFSRRRRSNSPRETRSKSTALA
jgi:hypothetical protein